ncbi:MAG: Rieske (2Fe-2S) protein [Chloroflexi bacterium]|nr:Rieske (2Fe-2S) protein [Chloroflexota bacterium]
MSKVRIASKAEVAQSGCKVYHVNGHTLALFSTQAGLYAIDNRCPHMGFPLDKGTVRDGILTCHWHHARFDLASGGAFDLFADDVPAYPVTIEGDDVWVDLSPSHDPHVYYQKRLRDGLEQELNLVVAKAVITLVDPAEPATAGEPFRIGLTFGSQNRAGGWAMGQTINTCMLNLIPHLDPADRPLALYQGLTAVARDTAGMAPRFAIDPLPGATVDLKTLKAWFRQFVEVRDGEGAERCLATALQNGATAPEVADLLFAAATDHRYLTIGHVADFTNKALEALDQVGWTQAPATLPSLIPAYVNGTRMEERNAWRHPIDLAAILKAAFEQIPAALAHGRNRANPPHSLTDNLPTLLGDDPQAIADLLLQLLADGVRPTELAQMVSYAAARRIVHFHTSNEFGDWDTVLHTFTYANAIQHAIRRAPSAELLRGVFDAAMSVYLDRFLNIPAAPLPKVEPSSTLPEALLSEFVVLLNKQQQVNEAGRLVAQYLANGGRPEGMIAVLGTTLLREDQDFHTIQTVETAVSQYQLLQGQAEAGHVLIAAARYLAAHAPTPRAQNQTYQIALRLNRGEKLFEG